MLGNYSENIIHCNNLQGEFIQKINCICDKIAEKSS